MKLKFEANLEYQNKAISSIVNLFKGQTKNQAVFSVSNYYNNIGMVDSENGIGNRLELDNVDLLKNLQEIQFNNGIEESKALKSRDFDIEMETGTGKTYVYLKSILELYINYGFTKFIIVVPSIAIKEGVYKSLEITKEHFKSIFNNIIYDYFIYDSQKLEQVRDFATADHVSIMVINIDAFRRSFSNPNSSSKANIIHRENDKLNGMKPIELIQDTNPFVIIDEPQSVDTTPKSAEAIKSLNPLATFRFSATHVKKHHMLYRLNAIDAFNMKLVKQIEVKSFNVENQHNLAYLRLKSVNNKKLPITARIEMDVQGKNNIERKVLTVKSGDDLEEKSKGRDVYNGYIVNEINCVPENEYVSFTSSSTILTMESPVGEFNPDIIKEKQIASTIKEHLDKALTRNPKGIKVLSLFFIDKVANYRYYDANGNAKKGKYAIMFEKNFKSIAKKEKYASLFVGKDIDLLAETIHNGYFAIDKKGRVKDTKGNTIADDDAYNLIMRDKEKLLSFDTDLQFIFSHSALREGWDNPNVFQICTLNETSSQVKKRQEIGRGLRLAVNQNGNRLRDGSLNLLTVMANESYDEFCRKLQKEYEEECGIIFGIIKKEDFYQLKIYNDYKKKNDRISRTTVDVCYEYLIENRYLKENGKPTDKLKIALNNKEEILPSSNDELRYDDRFKESIINELKKHTVDLPVKNYKEKRIVELNKQRFLSADFKNLWDKIKYKTTYHVNFNSNELIKKCIKSIRKINVTAPDIIETTAHVNHNNSGITANEIANRLIDSSSSLYDYNLPNILEILQNKTNLTRKSIIKILLNSKTLEMFKKNPQAYTDEVTKNIREVMKNFIVDGIKYTKISDNDYYSQELFENEELVGYLENNMFKSNKSIYDYVVYDSEGVEKTFAEKLEKSENVLVYTKLPKWFKINTPLGSYNPDWAIVFEDEKTNLERKLYFVVETKGNMDESQLRLSESAKIKCGKKHFEALGKEVKFEKADNFNTFITKART